EHEGDVDRQQAMRADRNEVTRAALVEQAPMGLAARARPVVPAHDVLEVVAQLEVVLLEHGDDQVAALAVTERTSASRIDDIDDRQILADVAAVALVTGRAEQRQ